MRIQINIIYRIFYAVIEPDALSYQLAK